MQEQSKKSYTKLSKKVYGIVKMIEKDQDFEDHFWALAVACTAVSRPNCTLAHSDFYERALDTVYRSIEHSETAMTDFRIE